MIGEVSEDKFTATNITKTLTIPGLKAGINHKYAVPQLVERKSPNVDLIGIQLRNDDALLSESPRILGRYKVPEPFGIRE